MWDVLTFAPEETTVNVTLKILDDDVVEAAEDVKLVLVAGAGERGVVFPAGMAAVNGIIEDDNDSKLFNSNSLLVGEEGLWGWAWDIY